MKYVYVFMVICAGFFCANTFAADSEPGETLSQQEKKLLTTCNLEARNSLVNGDMVLVEKVCMQAITEIEKTHTDKEVLVNPIMNMAFSYTLAGQFDKATPLYNRARQIREKLYGADSRELKEINDMVRNQEEMERQLKRQSKPGS